MLNTPYDVPEMDIEAACDVHPLVDKTRVQEARYFNATWDSDMTLARSGSVCSARQAALAMSSCGLQDHEIAYDLRAGWPALMIRSVATVADGTRIMIEGC